MTDPETDDSRTADNNDEFARKFEDKYEHYFPQLQQAYRGAFERMNDAYDSELVHAIDQQILNESEPFYDDGAFRIELPDDPADRVTAIVVDDEKLSAALDAYVDEIREQLRHVFGLVDGE